MKRVLPLIALLLIFGSCGSGEQSFRKLEWSRIKMDSTWDVSQSKSGQIIDKYKGTIDSLLIPVGVAASQMESYAPESPLSNLAADIIYEFASDYLSKSSKTEGAKVDMAMTNFGGIRAALPAGDVTPYDIMSVFPFDNKIVILDLQGRYVRELLENFARRERVEALSGVKLVIENKAVKEALVAGAEIDDNKIYKVATIDFLLFGGSNAGAFKKSKSYIDTGVFMRDMVADYFRKETKAARVVESKVDGRVVLIKAKEE